ncbi:Alkaline phosphatase D-related protein [Penicillium coprophilum]|uniref:Alkaline phosphatase D-related protein n=1 Tax=Penicillium coprophilum TaxID=36646 RepID=UPI0023930353|nr:Alkaline phosphatase D-related protein [Penicillium coprophilum]KAJ5159174.1 Alkaline phosphatase D-related protein [Penicillium coprophilum]
MAEYSAQPVNGLPQNGETRQQVTRGSNDRFELISGPLINLKNMHYQASTTWHGSVLIVTKPTQEQPQLRLRQVGAVDSGIQNDDGSPQTSQQIDGLKLYEDPLKAFWRFSLTVPVAAFEARWAYDIPGLYNESGAQVQAPWEFVVPAEEQSMRIMFHSCNGFSVGTDMNAWVGPNLWNDVMRVHGEKPFHVMVGGGDQIYNDGIRVDGPLKPWTAIGNPHKRRNHDFDNKMRADCDDYYYANYVRWYNTEPFRTANGRIPQVNIWDDHDIIDGFGSYTDHFMKCAVFRGIGGVAFKYYCLFQHHMAPPKSTYTTDSPQTMHAINGTSGVDPRQVENTYVLENQLEDDSWIIGKRPGPYVEERSRSLYMRFGKRIAFMGLDARTERTRHQVNYQETYDMIFERLQDEIVSANGDIKHLVVLLGVPIAYPRLAWLENILTSPLIAPIRLLNKRFGVAGGLFNEFDGQVDLLDDLDDHYTARQHKRERRMLIHRLQELARSHSVRVTILGGDVHLAAIGRFYSNPKLNLAGENDHRFIVNVVSSAITNKPPPKAVADLLARRNKIHHLDRDCDETLMPFFDKQPGGKEKSGAFNKVTMPSRNYAILTEVVAPGPGNTGVLETNSVKLEHLPKDGHAPLHKGEVDAGTTHSAADGITCASGMFGGLDVSVRVEIDPQDRSAATEGYGFSIPPLLATEGPPSTGHRLSLHSRRSHQGRPSTAQ